MAQSKNLNFNAFHSAHPSKSLNHDENKNTINWFQISFSFLLSLLKDALQVINIIQFKYIVQSANEEKT